MDELHDAIQDAQYNGAVTNAHRGPRAAFYSPTNAELTQFIEKQERTNGAEWLSIESILDMPLGFYFLRRFCEAENHGVRKMQLLVEVCKFRRIFEDTQRVFKAREIWEHFCVENPDFAEPKATAANGGALDPGAPSAAALESSNNVSAPLSPHGSVSVVN